MYARIVMLLTFVTLCASTLLGAQPTQAHSQTQSRNRCFPETGFCVAGPILDYWERNGGLAVFGYPISNQQNEYVESWYGPTQWFQRDRLEDHGSQGVLAGRLGAEVLNAYGRPWQSFPQVDRAASGCRYFAETRHSLCEPFLSYWNNNGGLARFGYPTTEPFQESLAGWTGAVQYFERRRMEHHIENTGTPYAVLLGLLGTDMHQPPGCGPALPVLQATAAAYKATLGCAATPPESDGPLAIEQFERGSMVWVGRENLPGLIVVIFFDNQRNTLSWKTFTDSWREGDPASGGERAPTGLYEPIRGFGKVWRENPEVRNTLGWAVEPERAADGALQWFGQTNTWMLYRAGVDRIYILYADGRVDDIARIK